MNRLLAKQQGDQPTLCISLIRNSVEYAKAVEDAGADGLKLHINLFHRPTGICIPNLEQEADRLQAVLEAVQIPVGIVPRGQPGTTRAEVTRLRDMGFDFVDLYGKNTSPGILGVEGITKWVAPTPDYTVDMLRLLAQRPDVDVIEAAFFPVEEFGSPVCLDDILRLQLGLEVLKGTSKPLVLPTDRKVTIEDLPALFEIGIKNYLLGYAVTGTELRTVAEATTSFRRALDQF
jgi:hypothetical protein